MSLNLCAIDNVSVRELSFVEETFGPFESRRILAIRNERRRAESVAGLVALKEALGGRTAGNIERDELGRPSFVGVDALDFSISHSGDLSIAALIDGPSGRVGVDIERIDEKKEDTHLRIAQRYFSKEEQAVLEASPVSIEFYKIWTAKEAKAKLLGVGLSKMLSSENSFEKSDHKFILKHFLLTYKGDRYLLALCVNKNDKLNFICGGNINIDAIK